MTIDINGDYLLERLRQRVLEPREWMEYCGACNCALTEVDHTLGECSQCEATLVDDESADEDCVDDRYGDY